VRINSEGVVPGKKEQSREYKDFQSRRGCADFSVSQTNLPEVIQ
jgi:hypothetical protein